MKMRLAGFLPLLLLSISILSYGFVIAHALGPEDCGADEVWQNNSCVSAIDAPDNDLNLNTNQAIYGQGGVVVIAGTVYNFENLSPADVTIVIKSPDNNIATVAQVHPSANGSFQTSIKADGPQFKAPGDYTIIANFPGGLTSEITFEFTGGTGGIISGGGDSKPITCGANQNLVNGKCVDKEPEPVTCGANQNLVNGKCVDKEPEVICGEGTEFVDGQCVAIKEPTCPKGYSLNDDGLCVEDKGGCLIATAAYGTELAPQVQFLREIRDNTVMTTSSGAAFMTGFNTLYYSFAPTVADLERENPMFKEAVRTFITPMISSLSIMALADNGSESEVLGLGISVIALNLGMYIAAPALIGFKVHRYFKTKHQSL
jgi:hypothetical protein